MASLGDAFVGISSAIPQAIQNVNTISAIQDRQTDLGLKRQDIGLRSADLAQREKESAANILNQQSMLKIAQANELRAQNEYNYKHERNVDINNIIKPFDDPYVPDIKKKAFDIAYSISNNQMMTREEVDKFRQYMMTPEVSREFGADAYRMIEDAATSLRHKIEKGTSVGNLEDLSKKVKEDLIKDYAKRGIRVSEERLQQDLRPALQKVLIDKFGEDGQNLARLENKKQSLFLAHENIQKGIHSQIPPEKRSITKEEIGQLAAKGEPWAVKYVEDEHRRKVEENRASVEAKPWDAATLKLKTETLQNEAMMTGKFNYEQAVNQLNNAPSESDFGFFNSKKPGQVTKEDLMKNPIYKQAYDLSIMQKQDAATWEKQMKDPNILKMFMSKDQLASFNTRYNDMLNQARGGAQNVGGIPLPAGTGIGTPSNPTIPGAAVQKPFDIKLPAVINENTVQEWLKTPGLDNKMATAGLLTMYNGDQKKAQAAIDLFNTNEAKVKNVPPVPSGKPKPPGGVPIVPVPGEGRITMQQAANIKPLSATEIYKPYLAIAKLAMGKISKLNSSIASFWNERYDAQEQEAMVKRAEQLAGKGKNEKEIMKILYKEFPNQINSAIPPK